MSDLVLVTGVTGFLGGHVTLQLLKAGYRVRGSLRAMKKADKVRDTLSRAGADVNNLEFVELDLLSDEGWQKAVEGARYVQHVASPFVTTMPDDKMELIRPAVQGTERALNAALAANVERIVLTSSMAAIMYGHAKTRTALFTSADWTNTGSGEVNAYIESKTLAERRAWELMQAADQSEKLAVINPAMILGPLLDDDPGTSAAIIQRLMNGSFPAAPNLHLGMIDVRDTARLHLAAMEKPEAGGHRFPASVETLNVMEIAKIVAANFPAYKKRMPRFQMPDWLVRLAARFDSDIAGVVNELGTVKRVDPAEAEALLGDKLIAPETMVKATAQTLIDNDLVKKP